MSSYPNVPLQRGNDWDRKTAQAVNHLLNQLTYYTFTVEGVPDAAQEIIDVEFPIPVKVVWDSCTFRLRDEVGVAPTADAQVTFTAGGSTIATGTILAGQSEGTISPTSTAVAAFRRFLVTAPNPQDATLSDFIISLAVSE